MTIIIYESCKDEVDILKQVHLQDELDYHMKEYGCKPKKIYILPFFERNKYKYTEHAMVLLV